MGVIPPSSSEAITRLRLGFHANGYVPLPVTDADYKHPGVGSPGKQPFFKNWSKLNRENVTPEVIKSWTSAISKHSNTGLLTGDLIGVDIDVLIPDIAAQIDGLAEEILGPTPLRRVGRAPKLLRCYRISGTLKKIETPELFLPDGMKMQVEVLASGQQFVAHGTHPDTGLPYRWLDGSPETVAFLTLPTVSEIKLRAFVDAAEGIMRRAGGVEKEKQRDTKPRVQVVNRSAATSVGGDDFFMRVNSAALSQLDRWFPALFPRSRQEAGTGAWRVSSAELGRNLEEDISFHPTEGGRDFGTGTSCSAIDTVLEWGGAPDVAAAALWICDQIGKDPTTLGWQEKKRARLRQQPTQALDAKEPPQAGDKPVIRVVAGELHHNATAAESAIMAANIPIFQRGPLLVRPIGREVPASKGRTTIAAGFGQVDAHCLMDVFSGVAVWQHYNKRDEDWVPTNPPIAVANILLSRDGQWNVPSVAGVITCPTLRPDGSVLSEAGYDAETRLYHVKDPSIVLHSSVFEPSRDDALIALGLLEDLLIDFPFVMTEGKDGSPAEYVSKSVALSAMITPVVRGAMSVAPLHAIKAYTPGTGKSYLTDTISAICNGRVCPAISIAEDKSETEKRITGLLLAGYPLVNIDNVNGELGGDLLAMAVERPIVQVRPLGGSIIIEIESRATFIATGNNLRMRGDMARRTLECELDAGVERPELRKFTGKPVVMVMANRGLYVSAVLTIVRAYIRAGCPNALNSLASYEDWTRLVPSALVWLGCPDPIRSMDKVRENEPELVELREMLTAWKAVYPPGEETTLRNLVETANEHYRDESGRETPELMRPELREALLSVAGDRDIINTKRLAAWLKGKQGRPIGTLRFRKGRDAQGGVARWVVQDTAKIVASVA